MTKENRITEVFNTKTEGSKNYASSLLVFVSGPRRIAPGPT
jgi:hypothetical protein